MKFITKSFGILVFVSILQGCNSIYFYETEKYSLTVEGRPDATSPASFNFGIKQRVAAIVPGKGGNMMGFSDSSNKEAVSLISYFNLDKQNETGWLNDRITVETAFVTGKVAANLAGKDKTEGKSSVGEVMNAISGADIGSYSEIADKLVIDLKNNSVNLQELKILTMKPFNQLTFDDQSKIVQITNLDRDIYNQEFHQALRNRLVSEVVSR